MKTKSILTTMALAGLIALPASAQNAPDKPKKPQAKPQVRPAIGIVRVPAFRAPDLGLTDKQKKTIAELRKAQSQAVRDIFQDKILPQEERRDVIRETMADFKLQIEAVYTKEQKAKLAKFRENQRKRLLELRKNRPNIKPGRLQIRPLQIKPRLIKPGKLQRKPAQPKKDK